YSRNNKELESMRKSAHSELKVSINQIQWVVTSYLLTISLLLLVWGKLSDLYGRINKKAAISF
ncbi:MAG TPA: hypothetical protein VHO66_03645, partial [Ruminiclostridium sp.]|nr:hypothetical protein [Ruminiclostridium sp.]